MKKYTLPIFALVLCLALFIGCTGAAPSSASVASTGASSAPAPASGSQGEGDEGGRSHADEVPHGGDGDHEGKRHDDACDGRRPHPVSHKKSVHDVVEGVGQNACHGGKGKGEHELQNGIPPHTFGVFHDACDSSSEKKGSPALSGRTRQRGISSGL